VSGVDRFEYGLARLGLVGLGVVMLALAVTSESAVGPLTDVIEVALERAGSDYVIAAALGVLAVLAGAAVFVSGRGATMQQTQMPTVERPVPVPSAGERFDETISSWRFATPVFGRGGRASVRDRLRAAAVAAVATAEGLSDADASRRVEDGAWTDDPVAAAFLAGEPPAIGTWIAALARRETGAEYRARRTVEAIVARRGLDRRRNRAVGGNGADE